MVGGSIVLAGSGVLVRLVLCAVGLFLRPDDAARTSRGCVECRERAFLVNEPFRFSPSFAASAPPQSSLAHIRLMFIPRLSKFYVRPKPLSIPDKTQVSQ